jgi:hypothetical protein
MRPCTRREEGGPSTAFMEQLMLVVKNLRPAEEPVPVTTKRIHA